MYESPRKMFRDMHKNPDRYIDLEEKAIIKEELEKDENIEKKDFSEKKQKSELSTSSAKIFKNSVDNIFLASLLEGENDEKEIEIIKQRQEVTLNYLNRILEDVKNYLSQISAGQLQKMSGYEDVKKYQAAVKSSDEARRIYHNRLISDIKIASRLININFNQDFPEQLRLQEESKMPDRKGLSVEDLKLKMSKRKYFKFDFPAGAFIDFGKMPKDPQGEREYIAHWAFMLYSDLSVLQTETEKAIFEIKKDKI